MCIKGYDSYVSASFVSLLSGVQVGDIVLRKFSQGLARLGFVQTYLLGF